MVASNSHITRKSTGHVTLARFRFAPHFSKRYLARYLGVTLMELSATMKEALPYISICIAVVSLCIAFYALFRDRTRFDVFGSYIESFANMVDGIYIRIVNSGRRPITLHRITFICKGGKAHKFKISNSIGARASSPFDNQDLSHPCLNESQLFEFMLDSTNFDFSSFEIESVIKVLIESSTGSSIEVKGLAADIKKNAHHLIKST